MVFFLSPRLSFVCCATWSFVFKCHIFSSVYAALCFVCRYCRLLNVLIYTFPFPYLSLQFLLLPSCYLHLFPSLDGIVMSSSPVSLIFFTRLTIFWDTQVECTSTKLSLPLSFVCFSQTPIFFHRKWLFGIQTWMTIPQIRVLGC